MDSAYPVSLEGELDPNLSRWLWLVKWLLAIPHYIVLLFLWIAFVVLWVVAFFAILFTGKYPKGMFDFNVGVLRWTWLVGYYTYGVLGTDRYPPFSLKAEDYPATLDVQYPEQLSPRPCQLIDDPPLPLHPPGGVPCNQLLVELHVMPGTQESGVATATPFVINDC